jgi:hypothetical protein
VIVVSVEEDIAMKTKSQQPVKIVIKPARGGVKITSQVRAGGPVTATRKD